jgi:hypothetical protein
METQFITVNCLPPTPETGGFVQLKFSFREFIRRNPDPGLVQECWVSLMKIVQRIGGRLGNLDIDYYCTTLIPPESHAFVGVARVVLPENKHRGAIILQWE